MRRSIKTRALHGLDAVFFHDKARLVEWLSALWLTNWALELRTNPGLLGRDNYAAFGFLGPRTWFWIFAALAMVQIVGMASSNRWLHEVRFVAMAFAAALWFLVGLFLRCVRRLDHGDLRLPRLGLRVFPRRSVARMETFLVSLASKGGVVGPVVVGVVLLIGVLLRQKGVLSIGDGTKVVRVEHLEAISGKLDGISKEVHSTKVTVGKLDGRVKDVENDLSNRPTRQELHDLGLLFARMDERFSALTREVKAARETIARVDRHMYEAATRLAEGKNV